MVFDVIVIGKGLIGSAAVRYLSQEEGKTAVIGPDEPSNLQTHDGPFASHYDQGRITRRLSQDAVWSALARQSISQYRRLEAQSGIHFYEPTGGLYVAPAGDAYLAAVGSTGAPGVDWTGSLDNELVEADADEIVYERLSSPAVMARFPFFEFPTTYQAIWEPDPAGHINPRALIQAQLAVAAQQGAAIIRETVTGVGPQSDGVIVKTDVGHTYRAQKVLVAAGAFSNGYGLLERPLPLRVKTESIILAEVKAAELARLAGMPTLIYQIESPVLDEIYLLPPIRYPDGRFYLKMGCNTAADQWPASVGAMRTWMIDGNSDVMLEPMREALQAILPGLHGRSWQTKRCLVSYTPSGYPIIDEVVPGRVYVAAGGNGSAAKSSDAIGRLAAQIVRP